MNKSKKFFWNKLEYVCSRGILYNCKSYDLNPISSSKNFQRNLSVLKDGETVYVCSSALPEFVKQIDALPCAIRLVTGDADEDVPTDVFATDGDFLQFINNPKIIHWYAQNCVIKHSKITPIPIGLDYHTLAEKTTSWGPQKSPQEQEHDLEEIRAKSCPFWEREPAFCYANFQFLMTTKYGWDRMDAIRSIPDFLVYYEPEKIPRNKTWEKQSKFSFVISPHGNGLDCHRTWEALCLGCIPIVKSSPIDSLFTELPVLIVKKWGEINESKLRNTIEEFKKKNFDYQRLNLQFWLNKIKS